MHGAAVSRAWKSQEAGGVEGWEWGRGGLRARGQGREGKSGSRHQGSGLEVSWCLAAMDAERSLEAGGAFGRTEWV